ncbi:MAG: hypothetical protein WD071_06900 [Pseudohongiella sp.]|uniref:hypothetical protein n=1 Tax=Pseudohongiella sp. TaxID=1979412 RepID=UPI0034A005CF
MIAESQYWKDELKKYVNVIAKKQTQKVWRDSSYAALEKSIMLSCYISRKLVESNKIPRKKFEQVVEVSCFRSNGRVVDLLNSHKLDELYDIPQGAETRKPFSYVANQIIHSFIFFSLMDQHGGVESIVFNSDNSKSRELYMVQVSTLLKVFRSIAKSEITKIHMRRNDEGEMVVVSAED